MLVTPPTRPTGARGHWASLAPAPSALALSTRSAGSLNRRSWQGPSRYLDALRHCRANRLHLMRRGVFEFHVTGLRRLDAATDQASSAGVGSYRIGHRLARIVAEAPEGCALQVRTRAAGASLQILVSVWATKPLAEARAGLSGDDAVLGHLAAEAAGLLSEVGVVSPVRRSEAGMSAARTAAGPDPVLGDTEATDSDPSATPFDPWALQITPQGPGFGERRTGFLRVPTRDDGVWAAPRMTDPEALARLVLAHPHLTLVQTVEPLSELEMEHARGALDAELGGAGSEHEEFLGTPLRAQALLVADEVPGTLPLRVREHLRGWFSAVELEEVPLRLAGPGLVMPEMLAAGMMRFPATTDNAFPGLRVEPRMVPYEGEPATAAGIRAGASRTIRDELCDIVLTDEVLSRHVQVIGETGSGKSTLLTALALETAARGQGFLFLDPHGTTVDRILRELDPRSRDRVWLIRCGDTANPVKLNPFAVPDPADRDLVIGDMAEAFQQLFDPNYEGIVGPRFQRIMRNTLASLSEVRGDRTSLLDVPRLLEDDGLAQSLESCLHDPALKTFWRNDFFGNRSTELNEVRAWVASKFSGFTSNAAMRAMLGSGADSFDPAAAMADDRIILLDLAKGEVGVTGSRVIGMLYLLRFWAAALRRPDPLPFTLFVDEAGSFSSVPLAAILAEGRKFGLRAVIAHQYMDQLVGDLLEAVEGSVATRAIFRVGHDDARDLALATHPEFGPLDLTGLPQFTAAARLADTGYPLRPFTLEIDHNERVLPQADADAATHTIRARTIEELVDPFREVRRMEREDLLPDGGGASRTGQELSGPGRNPFGNPPGKPRPRTDPDGDSFLDRWLAERRAQDARQDHSSATDDEAPASVEEI